MKRRRWLIIAGVLIVLCIMFYILLLRYFYFNKYNIHAPKAIIWRLNNVYGQEFVLDTISYQVRENTEEGPSYVYTWTFTLHDEVGTEFHAYLWLFGSHQYGEGMSYELDYGAAKMSDDYGQLVIEKRLGEQIDFDQYRRLKSTENPDEPDYLFVYKENNAQEIAEILTKIYFEEQQYTQGVGLRCKVTDEEGEELYFYTCWDVANHLEDEEITEETVYKYILQEIIEDTEMVSETFFFSSDTEVQKVVVSSTIPDLPDQKTELLVTNLASYPNGNLYELRLNDSNEFSCGDWYEPEWDRRHLGYFYVEGNTIYRINEYETDEINTWSEEELKSKGTIVCQESSVEDRLGAEEKGFHEIIDVDGNICTYKSYYNNVETDFFEGFIWEKGKGLVEYYSGYGAQSFYLDIKPLGAEIL